MNDFSWKPVALKAARGALLVGALILVNSDVILGVPNLLPEQYRLQATLVLGAVLPALRSTLKNRFAITLGGLL